MDKQATLLAWPAARDEGTALIARGWPVVWIVDPDGDPPADWSDIEDWMRLPGDPEELLARIDAVEQRALARASRPWVDDDDLLWHGEQWVALSPLEARVLRRLLSAPNTVVPRADITDAGWPDGQRDADLSGAIRTLRRKLEPTGVVVHTIAGRGYLAEESSTPSLMA